ncbi:general transcription factor 3C polypeptide 1 [Neoarius graeffei]|uniref:general transcription factor 3C polypeptide 1 n=1 Tax=Neoarius graeffei TaxID=443677 RepID=UPI00298BD2A7|nr:general transcription factor 3C polypeptide 1 [Neoarius graeffei]XP_060755327.1 general transcription factor 3C polypeptide 1 [Neoarius graeffei]XP_060755328.1 general transcription factor 3C polypeptide 1 [Neoarius graeffei]
MDALAIVLDEVALEGLDGITASSLWLRLESRQPPFPLTVDAMTREFVWRFLVSSADEVSFSLLPQDRPPVTIYDRFLELDPETGIQELRGVLQKNDDVYPASVVQDDPGGIQGSCLYYRERKNINNLIRTETHTPRLTLQEAHTKWGEKLVIVASQQVRNRALIGCEGNPELKLSDLSYCILERLGRARWQGELQRDLHTTAFKLDSGKIHYLRKSLDRNGLITMQSHVVRLPSGAQQHSILLLLKRFHVDRRSKYDILMEVTSNILSELPNNIGIMLKLRDQLRICERTFKKMYQHMLAAKMVSMITLPLQELNPDAGPCKTKKGTDITVRCLKLLKPYRRNQIDDDDDDENNDEDGDVSVKREVQARDIERDLLSQAYDIVVTTGPKGISSTMLRGRLNIGKLESRMICRVLERNQMIKGFMEDEGRQRTTKFISKLFVEKSKLNLDYTKEKERSEKLRAPQEGTPTLGCDAEVDPQEEVPAKGQMPKGKRSRKSKSAPKRQQKKVSTSPLRHSTPLRKKRPAPPRVKGKSSQGAELSEVEERDDSLVNQDVTSDHTLSIDNDQFQKGEESVPVFEEFGANQESSSIKKRKPEFHQTYRLLRRKNIIIEVVRNLKVIEGFYTLQKKLMDEEKMEGVNTKVCKKSVLRVTRALAREGFLKLFRTTVIQDGVTKKVEFIVHPSVTPDDPLVRSAIEQVRFKISSSYTVHRMRSEEDKAKALSQDVNKAKPNVGVVSYQGKTEEKMGVKELKGFKPSIVPGLSRSLGYQPKMPRLRMVQTFLWYLIYGHPLNTSHLNEPSVPTVTPDVEVTPSAQDIPQSPNTVLEHESADSAPPEHQQFTVYANELSWKRFVPPLPVHREYSYGWALISDVLISLPLSVYVLIIQISFKVDGLEEYLSDPVKQHYLIRFLPSSIKTRLLHRRKYFFSFYESLQKLCYIGLLQFGPTEKFMDKDQGFFFLKRHANILDTTVCEPHYNLAIETRPFEKRHYTFNTLQDVDNYWFDLMCVCLNTPLGVIRSRNRNGEGDAEREEAEPEVTVGTVRYERLQYTLKGSTEVVDDGVTPGDGQGAGGLDSSFFSHLKRNWLWTTYLLPKKPGDSQTVRLRNLLSKHPFPKSVCTVFQGGGPLPTPAVLEEEVQVGVEPSSRNQQVRGGKRQKRKRQKKEIIKPPKKKKKLKTRSMCQDETDRKALMRMTRQRVMWTHLEDSILMLCRVASHFLNCKIKKPFVTWNVVRDILHRDLELSLDKTSLSVSRRSRYIMKNPQTHLNYRICLAEVYQDKALVEQFMNRTNNYTDPTVCAEEFNEFVSALRMKFSSSCGSSEVVLPDTKEELFNKFKVYTIGDESAWTKDVLNSVEDIHTLVLNNLIQSTLVLSNMQVKSCRAFQSFSLYSKYNQEVLQQVFLSCKKRGLVNRRRANRALGPRKNRAVPCLPMSYQLSQHYYRYFSWRFPSTLYNDVYDLLEALGQKGPVDRPNTFSFQREKVKDEGEQQSGGGGMEDEDKCLAPPADVEDMLVFPMDSAGGATACCLTLLTLGLMSVDISVPQQIVVVDSTLVDNEVVKSITKELEEEEEEGGARFEVKAHQASHTNYLLMKGYFVPGIISLRNATSTEHIAVNACSLCIRLRNTRTHSLFTQSDSAVFSTPTLPSSISRIIDRQRMGGRSLEECVSILGYNRADVEAVQEVMVSVAAGEEFGIDLQDLYRKCIHLEQVEKGRGKTLQQYIQDLLDCEKVLEVGALSPRLVCMDFAGPWLLQCPKVSEGPCPLPQDAPPTTTDITPEAPPSASHLTPEALLTSPKLPLKRRLDQLDDGVDVPPVKRPNMETVAMETGESGAEEDRVKASLPDPPTSDKEEVVHNEDTLTAHSNKEKSMTQTQGGENTESVEEEEEDVLSFVARPWRVVDGSLNRPVCKGMLEALLLHIMTHPGVPEPALLQHYSGVLQPVVIMDLLKVLEELGCVIKRFIVNRPKASLFSRPAIPKVKGHGEVSVLEDVVAFYEPTVDCSLRLSKLFPHESCWNRWVQLCAH